MCWFGGKACLALEYLYNRYYMSNFFLRSSSTDESLLPLTPRQLAGKEARRSRKKNRRMLGAELVTCPEVHTFVILATFPLCQSVLLTGPLSILSLPGYLQTVQLQPNRHCGHA